jgi:hypothetical protein
VSAAKTILEASIKLVEDEEIISRLKWVEDLLNND